jgi:multidrug efflux pump subunit AcrB
MLPWIIQDLMTDTVRSYYSVERALNGVPGMKYMTSDAGNDGEASIQLVFNLERIPTKQPSMFKIVRSLQISYLHWLFEGK